MKTGASLALSLAILGSAALIGTVWTGGDQVYAQGTVIAPGLVLPGMNPQNGKKLFASKGCVVCHQVHGVGGTDAPPLDVMTMEPAMSPFDFFAKMWGGAEAMIAMQEDELGHKIEFTGQDLADIVAFVHNRAIQQTFTEADIPDDIAALMEGDEEGGMGMEMGDPDGMMEEGGGMMGDGK